MTSYSMITLDRRVCASRLSALLLCGFVLSAAAGCKPRYPEASPTPTPVARAASPQATTAPVGSAKPATSAAPTASAKPTTAVGSPAPSPGGTPQPSPATAGKRVEYAPGITIDYTVPQVEIASTVALREGLLELLLCAKGTKEHESILVTTAKPRQVYEAIGLIGVTPGQPPQFDPQTKTAVAASGDPVVIEIRTAGDAGSQTVPAHEWVMNAADKSPAKPQNWTFQGSRREGDTFMADEDGTIVCVVDFDSALVGLAEPHSSSNAELWAAANTAKVPPIGTACTVIIRGAKAVAAAGPATDDGPMVLKLTPEGFFMFGDKIVNPLELDEIIREQIKKNPAQKVELSGIPGTPAVMVKFAGRAILGSGIKNENLTMTVPEEPPAPSASPAPEAATPTPAP
jgi:hypothetical protein